MGDHGNRQAPFGAISGMRCAAICSLACPRAGGEAWLDRGGERCGGHRDREGCLQCLWHARCGPCGDLGRAPVWLYRPDVASRTGHVLLQGARLVGPIAFGYLRAMYSPTLGRFMQTDPIGLGGGANSYVYAGANPVNFIDPDGLNPVGRIVAAICSTPQGAVACIGSGLALGAAAANGQSQIRRLNPPRVNSIPLPPRAIADDAGGGDDCCTEGWMQEFYGYCESTFKDPAARRRCKDRANDRLAACQKTRRWPPTSPQRWTRLDEQM
jgi:RHS repeat-associated protein